MASGGDDLCEAGVGPETRRVHDWVPEGMELQFAFLVNIRRARVIVDAKDQKKFQGGFDYRLPMDCQAGNIQQYVHDYYSVARFKSTYAHALPALEGKQQWDIVDPGFKLCPLALKRVTGRPRKSRIRPHSEGAGLGPRRRKCTRCGGSGHFAKYCDNAVDPAFGECFDAPNDDQNDEQSDEPNEDPMEATNDEQTNDQNEDPMEATNDEKTDDQNEDPIEAPNDKQKNDQNDDPIDDPIEASNDEQIEAPNVGVQPSVVLCGRFEKSGGSKL
ncbi:hypothetical protein ACQ4PT_068254 [Festuca glaucescens]